MSYLFRLIKSNKEAATNMVMGYTDVGDGLSIRLIPPKLHTSGEVQFSCKLEGKYIGGVDYEMGGSIHHPDNLSPEDDDYQLMDAVTNRLMEIFPIIKEDKEKGWVIDW
jgi:hypothetical protein